MAHLDVDGCAICGDLPAGSSYQNGLVLDHDHDTGKIRGALCGRCNKGLGLLGDNLASLRLAVEYLEKNHGE